MARLFSTSSTSITAQRHNRFFIGIAISMLIVLLLGFGKSFYLRPWFTDTPLPGYLLVHGMVMTAWYLLFLLQTCLIAANKRQLHQAMGIVGLILAVAVVVTGLYVDINIIPHKQSLGVDMSDAKMLNGYAWFTLASMSSVIIFAGIIAAALGWRRNAAIHKRLMFWAFVWTLGPAFTNSRPLGQVLDKLVTPYLPFFPADFIWLALLLAYDWKTLHRFHPASYLGFITLLLLFLAGEFGLARVEILQQWLINYHSDVLPAVRVD